MVPEVLLMKLVDVGAQIWYHKGTEGRGEGLCTVRLFFLMPCYTVDQICSEVCVWGGLLLDRYLHHRQERQWRQIRDTHGCKTKVQLRPSASASEQEQIFGFWAGKMLVVFARRVGRMCRMCTPFT